MQKYKVSGVDHETGLQTSVVVEAADRLFAKRQAQGQGIDVWGVTSVPPEGTGFLGVGNYASPMGGQTSPPSSAER